MHMVNSFDPAGEVRLDGAAAALLSRRQRVLGAPYRLFYEKPVKIVRGHGVFLYDDDGLDYLDAYNNVPVVGHSNPRVQSAVAQQLELVNTHTRYLTDPIVDYAEQLVGLFPSALDQVIFASTGSEAVDLALRIARHVTDGQGVIVTRHAYHGTTSAVAAISPSLGPNNPIPANVLLVDAPDSVRDDPATATEAFCKRVEDAIALFDARGIPFAGMVVDSVLSSDGLQPGPIGVLNAAIDAVRAAGGLYIADEVQSGFGRIGSHWWGFQRHELNPDLVVLGKPMGNGLPISAVVGRSELFDRFGRDVRYFNTFGGNPVSIAAAQAVLDELVSRELLASSIEVGGLLQHEIEALTASDAGVAEVRSAGMFLGIEFVDDRASRRPDPARALRVVNAMRNDRILISASGRYDNVLKIRPPLVFGVEHAPRLLEGLDRALRV